MARIKAAAGLIHPRYLLPELPRNAEPQTGLSMGQHAQITADRLGITREVQNELAAASHRNLGGPTRKVSSRGSSRLTWASRDNESSPGGERRKDGATARRLRRQRLDHRRHVFAADGRRIGGTPRFGGMGGARRLPILATFVTGETAAVDFIDEREGLLMAPAYAVPRMLNRLGLTLQDFDYYEIHEAFAAVVLATLKLWESADFCRDRLGLAAPLGSIDRSQLNVKGSSLATGHPFAATGGRIVATLAKILADTGGRGGLISICAGGGQGVVAVLEREA